MSHESERLSRFLYHPIVFQQPNRAVHPPSWLEHIPFAFWMVEVLRPAVFVELGTQSGNSYSAFAQAIQVLGLPAAAYAVDTWRGDPQAGFYDEGVFAEWSRYHDEHFSAFSRLVRSTFEEATQHFADGSVDLLHIDGFHAYDAAAADFRLWRPKLSRRGVVLVHDINVRERDFGAWQLWEELKAQFPSFEFLHGHGLGVLGTGPDMPEALQWLFSRASTNAGDVNIVRQFFAQIGGGIAPRLAQERLAREAVRHEESVRLAALRISALEGRLISQTAQHEKSLGKAAGRISELERHSASDTVLHEESLGEVARRISALEESLSHATHLAAELQARLSQVEAERDGLALTAQSAARPRAIRSMASQLRRSMGAGRTTARTAVALGLVPGKTGWAPRSVFTFLRHRNRLREARLIVAGGLFSAEYYRWRYPDVAASRLTPLAHFVLRGAGEGRSPHPLVDTAYYLHRNPDVASTGVNPLIHYQTSGAFEGRNPHPLFDVAFYLDRNPDVRAAAVEPLGHFLRFGAADGRDPNPFFDCAYYLRRYPDVGASQTNPLLHYVTHGRFEGRAVVDPDKAEPVGAKAASLLPRVRMKVRSLIPAALERPTVLCLSHVMPWPPRAGNEYRIYRMLCWLRDQGYRIVPVIAPLPGEDVTTEALHGLADQFSNAVLCERDGRLEYVLRDVPDVLASLGGEFTRPVAALLGEDSTRNAHERQLLELDRIFCHDALITTALRLHQVLGRYVLLTEYIWMSRILPLISGDVLKVIDTIDVFSTKREKVLQFGIDDLHVDPREEARRLKHADLILAIHEEERQELQRLRPETRVITVGVDFDVVEDAGIPSGRRVLYVASDNPMNRKGLLDFLRFAWPQIRRDVPDAELLLAGRVGSALDGDLPGVIRLGLVDDLGPLYAQCRVVINPAVAGTGVKIKTLEALGHFRPLVAWPNGTDGLPTELSALCATAQDWFEFSRHVARLLAADAPSPFSPAERDAIIRLTSPATAYHGMTEALTEALTESRVADD